VTFNHLQDDFNLAKGRLENELNSLGGDFKLSIDRDWLVFTETLQCDRDETSIVYNYVLLIFPLIWKNSGVAIWNSLSQLYQLSNFKISFKRLFC